MIVELIKRDYSEISDRFDGTRIINPKASSEMEIGKKYIVFKITNSIQNGAFPGMTYYSIKEGSEPAFPIQFPAELFKIIENRIPSSYRVFKIDGTPTSYEICHPMLNSLNFEYLELLWDYDESALEDLNKIEHEIITELGYENYFKDRK